MGTDIEMPRGDLRQIAFTVHSADSENSIVTDFDEIYFTVKKNYTDKVFLFQKKLTTGDIELTESGDFQFTIQPEDTDKMAFGQYVFDVEVIRGNEIKQTLIVGYIRLTEEVTHVKDEV